MISHFLIVSLTAIICAEGLVLRDSPVTSLTATKSRIRNVTSPRVDDQQRARTLRSAVLGLGSSSKTERNVPDETGASFDIGDPWSINVDIGTPPLTYTLFLDTARVVPSVGTLVQSESTVAFESDGEPVLVVDPLTDFLFFDTVSLGPGLTATGQAIASPEPTTFPSANDPSGFLGLGRSTLSIGTFIPDPEREFLSVIDNIGSLAIPFSFAFNPTNQAQIAHLGVVTFGGIDSSLFTGELISVPLTNVAPSASFWGFDASITFGSTTLLSGAHGIVDTGTNGILLATDLYEHYASLAGIGPIPPGDELAIVNPADLQNLILGLPTGDTLTIIPDAQVWPEAQNDLIPGGENPDEVLVIVADLGSPSGEGLDFVLGNAFLERFFVSIDPIEDTISFATTQFTNTAGINIDRPDQTD